jgi:hypothetical protein
MIDDPAYTLYQMHRRFRDAQQRARFVFSRARSDDPRKELAGMAEHAALTLLQAMGYRVTRCGYNAAFDLWVEGARVEVKAATWSGGRYQAQIRNHDADLLLFCCQTPDGSLEWFVIPAWAYAGVSNIAVWTRKPAAYGGQWCEYYRAWWFVDATVSQLPEHRGWQLSFLE